MLPRRYFVVGSMLLALVLIPVAFALESTHRDPQILVANCGTGPTTLTANTTQVAPGSSGTIMFSCGLAGSAIIVVHPGMALPNFSLPPGYSSLTISSSSICSSGVKLTSGSRIAFDTKSGTPPTGNYNYCAFYSNAPKTGLASFKIIWSKQDQVTTVP